MRIRGHRTAELDASGLLKVLIILLVLLVAAIDLNELLPARAFAWGFTLAMAAATIESQRRAARRQRRRGDLLLVAGRNGVQVFAGSRVARATLAWTDLTRLEVGVPQTKRKRTITTLTIDGDHRVGPAWTLYLEGNPQRAVTFASALLRFNAAVWRSSLDAPIGLLDGSMDEAVWQALEGCDAMTSACLKCRYPRSGLPKNAPCPECGAPPPGSGSPLLHGRKRGARGCGWGAVIAWLAFAVGILAPLLISSMGGIGCLIFLGLLAVPLLLTLRGASVVPIRGTWLLDRQCLVITDEPGPPVKIPWEHVVRAVASEVEGGTPQVEVHFAALQRLSGAPDRPKLVQTILAVRDAADAHRVLRALELLALRATRAGRTAPPAAARA